MLFRITISSIECLLEIFTDVKYCFLANTYLSIVGEDRIIVVVTPIPEPIKCDNCNSEVKGMGTFLYDGLGLWLFCSENCFIEKQFKIWHSTDKKEDSNEQIIP